MVGGGVARSNCTHDASSPLRPRGLFWQSQSLLQSRFLVGARIRDMGTYDDKASGDPADPIARLRGGDRHARATLFDRYRHRRRGMVELRLDPCLRARLDASDVVQEVVVDIARALDADLADPRLSPRSWSRLHVGRRLTTMHRQHLGTKMRDAGPEVSLYQGSRPEASSAALTSMILGRHTSPTQAARRRADAQRPGGAEQARPL